MVYGSKEKKDPSERERENRLGPSFVLTCSSFNVHYDTKQWTPVRNLRGAVFLCFFLLSKSEPFWCYLVKLQRLNENWCVKIEHKMTLIQNNLVSLNPREFVCDPQKVGSFLERLRGQHSLSDNHFPKYEN